jgi:MFS family permease
MNRLGELADEYPRQFWLLFGGMLITATGGSMAWPFLSIYLRQRLDIPLTTVGLLLSLNSGAGLISTFLAGPVADRFGRKGVMAISLFANSAIYATMSLADSLSLWAVLMALGGAVGPLYRVGSNAMVADLVPPDQRASAYALLRMSSNLGIAIGPAVGGFVAVVSYSSTFLTAAAAFLTFGLLLLLFVRETLSSGLSDERPTNGGYGPLLRDRPFLAFCGVSTLVVMPASMMMVLLSVYAKEQYGVPENQYGFIMATNAAMVVAFQYLVTQVTKRYSHLRVMAIGALFYAIGVGSVALGRGFAAFLISMAIMTIGELILVPTGTTLAANLSPPDMRGRYMGIYGLTWGIGFGTGPVLGGYLNDHLAPVAIWYGGLIIGLVSTLGYLLLTRWFPEPAHKAT